MEERRLRTDNNPVAALFELISSRRPTAAHPYQWPTIGWMNDLPQATREDALAYYRTFYSPGERLHRLRRRLSPPTRCWRRSTQPSHRCRPATTPPAPVRAIEPTQQGERRTVLKREAQLPFVTLAYHVPNLSSADGPALEVLSAVPRRRQERAAATSTWCTRSAWRATSARSYELTSVDPGLFFVYAQPLPGKPAAQLEKELLARDRTRCRRTAGERARAVEGEERLEAGFVLGAGFALLSSHAAGPVRGRRRLALARHLRAQHPRRHRRRL